MPRSCSAKYSYVGSKNENISCRQSVRLSGRCKTNDLGIKRTDHINEFRTEKMSYWADTVKKTCFFLKIYLLFETLDANFSEMENFNFPIFFRAAE